MTAQRSWAALWLGSGQPPPGAVTGDDNGSSIISAPESWLRCFLLIRMLNGGLVRWRCVTVGSVMLLTPQNESFYRVGEVCHHVHIKFVIC